jgi:hypothetical protein
VRPPAEALIAFVRTAAAGAVVEDAQRALRGTADAASPPG